MAALTLTLARQQNAIGEGGARAFAEGLRQSSFLTTLCIGVCKQLPGRCMDTDFSGAGEQHRRGGSYGIGRSAGAEQEPHTPRPLRTYAAVVT